MTTRTGVPDNLSIPFEPILSVLRKYKDTHPDKTAIVDLDQDKTINYRQLYEMANRVALFLEANGIKKGDRIAVLSEESIEKLIIWMGIWRFGAVICPLNVEMNQAHMTDILGNLDPKMTLWHVGLDGPALTKGLNGKILKFDSWAPDMAGDAGADEFFAQLMSYPCEPELQQWNEAHDISCIFCTSGTTDKPKCVIYDHLAYWLNGLDTLDMLGLTGEDKTLEYRSFGWNSAQVLSLMPWIETGLTMHIARKFSHSRFFEWIKAHNITFSAGVPTVVNMLLNKPLGVTAKDIPSLRLMTCSTAPLSPEQWKRFEEMYGVTLLQLYGMSEAGWVCGNRHYRRRMGTVGPPAKYQEFRIVDAEGNEVPQGSEGEVSIGGPQTCIGVITPEGVYEDMSDVRLKTGDLAVIDEDGFVTVTGRTKDLIIRGGVNIAPLEIDNILLSHPKVSEAAAVGVPDAIYGEEVIAYAVAKPGETLSEEELKAHCGKTLPDFKVPKQFFLVDELPKSDRGKVKRDVLKDQWQASQAAE